MAARINLTPLQVFDPISDPSSIAKGWKRFETYLIALNITDDKQKRALLFYQAGELTQDIFNTIPDTGEDYPTAMTKLNEYFASKKIWIMKCFNFDKQFSRKMRQLIILLPD